MTSDEGPETPVGSACTYSEVLQHLARAEREGLVLMGIDVEDAHGRWSDTWAGLSLDDPRKHGDELPAMSIRAGQEYIKGYRHTNYRFDLTLATVEEALEAILLDGGDGSPPQPPSRVRRLWRAIRVRE